jgi:hypothetical protein
MRLGLTGGAYEVRSVIASAQRSLNLYGEPMPEQQGEPALVAHYPTPGLKLLGTLPQDGVRGIRQASNGNVYAVAGSGLYRVDTSAWSGTLLGSLATTRHGPVSMVDNGTTLVVVDGSPNGGWTVDIASDAFAAISDPAGVFIGADTVAYTDTYFVFNKPGTPQFYWSGSLAATFDPLDFANKESFSDLLVTLAVARREIWLLGERSTEIWYNIGQAGGITDSVFAQVQSTFVDHGTTAKYSVVVYDNAIFWLSRDRQGHGIVLQGAGYQTKRISTFAIENEIASYARTDDATGFTYQLAGHTFYVLTFPTADHTWVYDISTGLWHEWLWIDPNGEEHRHRANCCYPCDGFQVVGDWQNGNLYQLDIDTYTDNGAPIKRIRTFPHIINQSDRVFYRQFVADLETGWASNAFDEQQLIRTTFTAPNGTLLENYSYSGDVGGWTAVSGEAEIVGNVLVGTGAAEYQSTALMTGPDYVLSFKAIPMDYSTVPNSEVHATARSGYTATIRGDGTQYWADLAVVDGSSTSIAMGTIPSGWFAVTLRLLGAAITLSVQRSSDSLWLRGDGAWTATASNAITVNDDTYPAPGQVTIGGSW